MAQLPHAADLVLDRAVFKREIRADESVDSILARQSYERDPDKCAYLFYLALMRVTLDNLR